MKTPGRLLVVDDEEIARGNLVHALSGVGHQVTAASSGTEALRLLARESFEVVLTDLRMEQVDGMAVLQACKAKHAGIEVILVTGYATLASAVDAMKAGAFHYVSKPYRLDEVRHLVEEALQLVRLRRENHDLHRIVDELRGGNSRPVTGNRAMLALLKTAAQAAGTDCNVLISGESGTGKEVLARYIHAQSLRSQGPYVALNCAAFPEDLLANELFGHQKGAYTGATEAKAGLIETANGGTLLLDEITEMSPPMQAKLLRVIQEREFLRLGATQTRPLDVRFIAATNRRLAETVEAGQFRRDLYYRLNVVGLELPPLRDRRDDIPLLAKHFITKHAALQNRALREISTEAMELLSRYDFPGNVRELENIIERAIALSTGNRIEAASLPDDLQQLSVTAYRTNSGSLPKLEEHEEQYIRWVLERTGGNRSKAAEILGIDRVSLWRKLKRYGLDGTRS